MKATGIVRRVDELGRLVIPKEIRRTLRIREADPLEIFTDRNGEIILKKYSPIRELSSSAGELTEALAQVSGQLVCVCDQDHVVAAAGMESKKYQGKPITQELEIIIKKRQTKCGNTAFCKIMDEDKSSSQVIVPIICAGDVIGAVLMLGNEGKTFGEQEQKLAEVVSTYLGKLLED